MMSRHDNVIKGMPSAFFGTGWGLTDCEWRTNLSKKGDVFSFL